MDPHTSRASSAELLAPRAALSMLAMEWVIAATTFWLVGEAFWLFVLLGACIAGCATVGFQLKDAHNTPAAARIRGFVVALVVCLPLPITGTVLAVVALAWRAMSRTRPGRTV